MVYQGDLLEFVLCVTKQKKMIQLQFVAAMYHYYKYKEVLQLDPPIVFGRRHSYDTCCGDYFANICNTKLFRTKLKVFS